MAKKKVKRAAKAVGTRIRYRARELKPIEMMIGALIASLGGIGSSWIVNNTPMLKDLNPVSKSLAQIGTGMGALFLLPRRFNIGKKLGVGAFMAGSFGLVQKVSDMPVLAGEESLTNEQIGALLSAGYLNGPAQLAGPARMGAGERPQFMGAGENPAFMGTGFKI